jgi:hypothetical protein
MRGTGDRKSLKHAHMTKQSTGRRLMPAELAKAAAEMGVPVSTQRYAPQSNSTFDRAAVAPVAGERKPAAVMLATGFGAGVLDPARPGQRGIHVADPSSANRRQERAG